MVAQRHKIAFTQAGFDKVHADFKSLQVERKEAVLLLQKYREMGDLSENSAYRAAKWKLSTIDRQIKHLKNLIKYGEVRETRTGMVDLGCTVTVEVNGQTKQFQIVGGFEADPAQAKLTTNSPIGRALMGRKIGETVTVVIPAGSVKYKIINIA